MSINASFEKSIADFPRQLGYQELAFSHLEALREHSYDSVIFLGIGGSALAAEIVQSMRNEIGLSMPIVIWKDYGLPPEAKRFARPLFIAVSFSGNTAEPLSGTGMLLRKYRGRKRHRIAVIASGGALLETALRHDLPLVRFSGEGLQPRQGTGFMFYSVCAILRAAHLIPRPVPDCNHLSSRAFRGAGMRLAHMAKDRLIVIYSEEATRFIGYLWKIRCNENGKTPAFNNVVPEMEHNEIVGFEGKRFPAAALFLGEEQFSKALARQTNIVKKILARYRVRAASVPLSGKTLLEQTWNAVMRADWFSYFLAVQQGVNPREIRVVDELKKELRK